MTDAARSLLALHREAWTAIRALLDARGVALAWSTRLLYGWRGGLHSLAWRLQPRPRAAAELPVSVFVGGTWRCGTTLLHECLARDARWRAPTTQECMNPGAPMTSAGRSVRRPMDQLPIAADSPQEDEFALLLLGAPSFYRALLCPSAWPELLDALAAGETHADWGLRESRLRELCAWLQSRDARGLLLKSPTHGFALARLLGIAPGSRAVLITRDWQSVWRSSLTMWSAMFARYALAPWTMEDVAAMTKATMIAYAHALPAQLQRIDAARIAAIDYDDLAARPAATLRALYARFGWETPAGFGAEVEALVRATRPPTVAERAPPDLRLTTGIEAADEALRATLLPCRVTPA